MPSGHDQRVFKVPVTFLLSRNAPLIAPLQLPRLRGVPLSMSKRRSEYLDAESSARSVAAKVFVREEPDDEEDEEDDGEKDDNEDEEDSEGYSE